MTGTQIIVQIVKNKVKVKESYSITDIFSNQT
jgi:hypothetical protein